MDIQKGKKTYTNYSACFLLKGFLLESSYTPPKNDLEHNYIIIDPQSFAWLEPFFF